MRNFVWVLTFLVLVFSFSSGWAEEKPQADYTVDVLSQYVWRGFALSDDSVVIEPSMTVSYLGFYVNFWGNYDTDQDTNGEAKWNETDFTFGYTYDELPYGLSLNLGGIYYALDGTKDSFEIFAGLSGTCPRTGITLGATVYREVSHYPGWWIVLGAGRDFALPYAGSNLNLSLEAVYLDSQDEGAYPDPDDNDEFSDWLYLKLGAEVTIPLGEYFSLTPKVYYSFSLTDDADDLIESISWDNHHDHFYGGVSLSFSF
ncbi:MAG: hypothetical protein GXO20_04595 [Thermodesulfobacteria bacterium]|nr:hypothetical protein [Thermodesulfobacteriota bacterium]